jgi:hypothetical protein
VRVNNDLTTPTNGRLAGQDPPADSFQLAQIS